MSSRSFFVRFSAFNAFLFLGTGIQMPFLPLWLRSEGLSDSQISLIVAALYRDIDPRLRGWAPTWPT